MRIKSTLVAVLGGVSLASMSSAAFAGGCGNSSAAQNCSPGVVVNSGVGPTYNPMSVNIQQPMGHLRSVQFSSAPNVSIMRVHSMDAMAGLEDAPSAFTKGCHPTSSHYCRGGDVRPAPAPVAPPAPVAMPYVAPPVMAAPIMPAPVMVQPQYVDPRPRTVYVGGGYDESKFQPRQYGENTFTPGIAHIPTSYVDRGLNQNGGYTMGEFQHHKMTALAAPGIAPLVPPTAMTGAPVYGGVTLPGTYAAAPAMAAGPTLPGTYAAAPAMGGVMGYAPQVAEPMVVGGLSAAPQNSGPVQTTNGLYASPVAADGTYWEKTSGPTVFGSTIATQVICRRQLPTQQVRPIIGVPTAVPVPVNCAPVPHGPQARHKKHHAKKAAHGNARYGAPAGRWTY